MAARGKLSSLNDQLIMLVEQQKKLADEFTHYLTDPKVRACRLSLPHACTAAVRAPCCCTIAGRRLALRSRSRAALAAWLQDGLRENTRKAIKNLDAAVVASKQPGYFNYHEPSARVKKVEQGNLLKKKLNEIKRVEKQIQHVREQMARCEEERKAQVESRAAGSGSQVHSLKQVRPLSIPGLACVRLPAQLLTVHAGCGRV